MKISLNNFRSHINSSYTIPDVNLILLKGPSGAGKSTIFQAIYWCLYGSLNHVFNHSSSSKCSVEIKISNMTIYRQKKPELFKVEVGDKFYEDDVAQGIINNTFGNRVVWNVCSYLNQNSHNLLLTASNNDKMKLIHELSFNNEDPDKFIAKIETELIEKQKQLSIKQAVYNREVELLSETIKTSNLDKQLYLEKNDPQRHELVSKLSLLNSQLIEYKNKEKYQNQLRGQINLLKSSLEKIVVWEIDFDKLIIENNNLETSISQLNSQLAKAKLYSKNVELRNKCRILETKLSHYDDVSELFYTENDLINAGSLNEKYNRGIQICRKYGVNYKETEIKEAINNSEILVEIDKFRALIEKIHELKQKLEIIEEVEFVDLKELDEKITIAQLASNVLKCPHCNGSVRLMERKLQPSSIPNISPRLIVQLMNERDRLVKQNSLYENKKLIKTQLENYENQLMKMYQNSNIKIPLTDISKKISSYPVVPSSVIFELKSIVFVENIPDIKIIKNVIERTKLAKELVNLKIQISSFGDIEECDEEKIKVDISKLNSLLMNNKTKILQNNENKRQKLDIETQLAQLYNNIDESYLVKIPEIEIEIIKIKNQTIMITKYDELYEKRSKLEIEKEEIVKLHTEVFNLGRLKEVAMEVECQSLQNTVDSINAVINDIAPLLFDDPITIKLNLFKNIKSKERMKPIVNLSINYRGGEYDNINQLSGGEGDRVSLILTLSLSKLSKFPMILLDESLSSLDSSLKEMATKAIRLNTNKSVICINHEGTEGYYDYQMIL